jgi:hypothetical protein
MKQLSYLSINAAAVLAVLACAPLVAGAQAAGAKSADGDVAIDQDAMDALNKMGAYLRTLKAFQVHAVVTDEDVMLDGQKVQSASIADLVAERPEHLRLSVTSDLRERLFFYDGKTFTMFARRPNFYATVPAPSTIVALVDSLDDRYGIELPFVDLFRWGTPSSDADAITGARDIGPSQIDGVTCEQYAFRQAGLDWQVWIQEGDFPLPRKLVLTTLTDEARPEHTAVYTWNLAPSVSADAFTFVPPTDAKKITIVELVAAREKAKKSGREK